MPDARTRSLIRQDNLQGLAETPSRSIRLVYMDPPFGTGRDFERIFAARSRSDVPASSVAFTDRWSADTGREELSETPQRLRELLDALALASGVDRTLLRYLEFMTPRIVEAYRVLRDDGTLFLHCDPTSSHYLKIIADAVFGRENFRNEVVWRRTHSHGSARRFGPIHDTILFYSKTNMYPWHVLKTPYTEEYVNKAYRHQDSGGRYQLITCTGPGDRVGTRAHYAWKGRLPPPGRHWAWTIEKMQRLDAAGLLVHSQTGVPRFKRYLHDGGGVALQDIWDDINRLNATSRERVRFETQKPLALLRRIIDSCTDAGDIVLDPFCGSGTTMVAAEQSHRGWIGIDVSLSAVALTLSRVRQGAGSTPILLSGLPRSERGVEATASKDPLGLAMWATAMLCAVPDDADPERGFILGTGTLPPKDGLRSTEVRKVTSWVPLNETITQMEPPSPQQQHFLLTGRPGSDCLEAALRSAVPDSNIELVEPSRLVAPDAQLRGMAVGLA